MKRKSIGVSIVALLLILATGIAVYTGTASDSESNDAGIVTANEYPTGTLATLWNIQIDGTESNDGRSDFCEMAEDDTATEGPGDTGLDIINSPPSIAPSLDLYFYNSGTALTRDCRSGPESHPTTKTWELAVVYSNTTPMSSTTVTLTWDPADFGLTEYTYANLTVYGDPTTVLADMTSTGSYSFSADAGPTSWFDIVLETSPAAPSGDGSDCANAIVASIPADLDYITSDTTCGLGNDYEDTDMGSYDGGEDIIYRLDVSSDTDVEVTVTSLDGWIGVGLFDDCPDVGNLLADDSGYSGPYTFTASLLAAESPYYLMIDSWPSPDCVDFDLTIEEDVLGPGDTCPLAIPVTEGLTSCPGAPLWYSFTYTGSADCDIMITSNLAGQMVDTKLEVYDACGGTLVAEADDDFDGYYNYASTVQFPGVPGTDYKIFWDPYWSSSPFDFEIEVICPPHDVGTKDITSPFGSILRGDVGLAQNLFDDSYTIPVGPLDFDLNTPSTYTSLSTEDIGLYGADWVDGEWLGIDADTNDLVKIDEADGSVTVLGNTGLSTSYYIMEGLAYNDDSDTMYAAAIEVDYSGYIADNKLYTIASDGTASLVGSMGYSGQMMGIAFDNEGTLYGINLADSHLYEIDTSDASITDIGYLGLDLSYAQDIAFDREDEVMYWAAYDSAKKGPSIGRAPKESLKANAGLYEIDLDTGAASFVADFAGNPEIGGFAIPAAIGPAECDPPGVYPVQAVVKNYGGYMESFDVTATITNIDTSAVIYTDTVSVVDLAAGDEVTVDFADWDTEVSAPAGGNFIVEVCTELVGDEVPANDCDDEDGCIAAFADPVADPNGPYTVGPGDDWTVTFDGSASYDTDTQGPSPDITKYEWDFGDGMTGTGMNPTHTYYGPENNVMTYTVTLTVTDNDAGAGEEATDTATTTVTLLPEDNDPPIIQINNPEDGSNVNGNVNVEWFATDDSGMLNMYLYYKPVDAENFQKIAGPIDNTGEYSWNTGSLADGDYLLMVEAVDLSGVPTADSVVVTVGNGNSGVMLSDVLVQDTSIDSTEYVKDGDTVVINAAVTGDSSLKASDIKADLSGFGRSSQTPAGSFDGFTATWTLHNVICHPSDGPISVTVSLNDMTVTSTITADNTAPDVTVEKPTNGFWFYNSKLLPMSNTFILGPIEIQVSGSQDITRVEFLIDDELKFTDTEPNFEWYMNQKLRGVHTLTVTVFDAAGNPTTSSQQVRVFNLFGEN